MLSGANFKADNDVYAANVERMLLNDENKVVPVGESYQQDILDEPSINSYRSIKDTSIRPV